MAHLFAIIASFSAMTTSMVKCQDGFHEPNHPQFYGSTYDADRDYPWDDEAHYKNNYCLDEGYAARCYLWINKPVYQLEPDESMHPHIMLFDPQCYKLGEMKWLNDGTEWSTTSITSKLRYTVELNMGLEKIDGGGDWQEQYDFKGKPAEWFLYAGRRYNLPGRCTWCKNSEGSKSLGHCCRVAFDCSAP
jgi:hypothetical protein